MADSNKPQDDLSIEEILGSIRRIIAEDDDTDKPAEASGTVGEVDDEPLALTQRIEEDGTITQMDENDAASAEPFEISLSNDPVSDVDNAVEPEVAQTPANDISLAPSLASSLAEEPTRMTQQEDELVSPDNLLSSTTAEATSAVMAKLARHTAIAGQASSQTAGQGATIESLVREMLRPLLREWLDQNLPEMVETMVARELEKLKKNL